MKYRKPRTRILEPSKALLVLGHRRYHQEPQRVASQARRRLLQFDPPRAKPSIVPSALSNNEHPLFSGDFWGRMLSRVGDCSAGRPRLPSCAQPQGYHSRFLQTGSGTLVACSVFFAGLATKTRAKSTYLRLRARFRISSTFDVARRKELAIIPQDKF